MKVTVQINGVDKTIKKLRDFGTQGKVAIDGATLEAATKIAQEAKKNAPVDMGSLRQNIQWVKISEAFYIVLSSEPYSGYVEFGTGVKVQIPPEFQGEAAKWRGRAGGNFDEALDKMRGWCRRHGIPEDAAYPTLASILEKGLTPQPFMYPAFVMGRIAYRKELERALNQLIKKNE